MDVQEVKRLLAERRITYDSHHFPRRCRERDRSTGYIIGKLEAGRILSAWENPRPADSVQYDRSLIVEIPDSSTYRYQVVVYLKGERQVYLKTVWRVNT